MTSRPGLVLDLQPEVHPRSKSMKRAGQEEEQLK